MPVLIANAELSYPKAHDAKHGALTYGRIAVSYSWVADEEMALLTLNDLTAASTSSAHAREALERKSLLKSPLKRRKEGEASIAVPPSLFAERAAGRAEAFASTIREAEAWEPLVRSEVRRERVIFGVRKKSALTKKVSFAEVNEQRSEVAASRSALHYAAQKAKYYAGVKSKAFARGRKKRIREAREAAKAEAAAADPEAQKKFEEERAKSRAEERSTLRHNSASAWARGLKKRGRAARDANRDASRQQLELGRELCKKQEVTNDDDDADEEASQSLENEQQQEQQGLIPAQVAALPFMQRHLADTRLRAEREADQLLVELQNDESDEDQELKGVDREEQAMPVPAPFPAERLSSGSLRIRRAETWLQAAARAKSANTVGKSVVVVETKEAIEELPRRMAVGTKRKVRDLTQDDLVDLAFDAQAKEEFEAEKKDVEETPSDQLNESGQVDLPGWGHWTGLGTVPPPPKRRKTKIPQTPLVPRVQTSPHVILNPKLIKAQAKLKVAQVPYPFKTRAQYEKYMAQPIGEEWNAKEAVAELTKPAVTLRRGVAIEPISKEAA